MDKILNIRHFSIQQIKFDLSSIIQHLKNLQNFKNLLTNSINSLSNDKWNEIMQQIFENKLSIDKLLHKYENQIILNKIKQKLNKTNKKRIRHRRKIINYMLLKREKLKKRKELHEKIDNCIKNEKEKYLKLLQQEEHTKNTEKILFGIMKKKSEAKRYIELLMSLKELRNARKIGMAQFNQINTNENSFENKINQLISVWKDALREYELESDNIKSFLSKNSNINKSIEEQWHECLFGNYSSNEMISLKAEENLQYFLEIRNNWDSYIVPENSSHGSSIPFGYVLPNDNPSEKWKIFQSEQVQ